MTSEQPHVFITLLLRFLFQVFVGPAVSLFTGIFMPTSVTSAFKEGCESLRIFMSFVQFEFIIF